MEYSFPDVIRRRIEHFWGYGSLNATVWFVGMEEGLGPTTDTQELETRFRAADGKTTIDMRRDMSHLVGHMKWFRSGAPIQPTWKHPIALYLYLKNHRIPTSEEIREHQGLILGDSILKESSTIELMPLPSQKAHESTWLYASYPVLGLRTRKEYLRTYKPARILGLKQLIAEHTPKLIIFFSVGYLPEWAQVIGKTPEEVTHQMYFVRNEKTAFCIIPQGASFGMSYKRLYNFASRVKDQVVLAA
ncbi:MAG: hypothetical protein A3H57_04885 [Candidatus Taylorbacteria bacterium RIFCSPLOWO2_02_FULL_43_11]|uniref:Uncharacterized protein n=1 Tax=Candidatus Taylorbacteria bacterium RIFCSPHIGHO2_02_FULL_43_32b TaxID=1802306 RepID=A0A1G2MGJ9_9BACT|nr:MAG: hypothetical protein A3C72_01505 [Candidatus Taylorbacteria bacterium RIFCSPHIGHO2_02_FULL_43_32b]OHA37782.1 MAG: hypothetical protein A3H57_04885 [Candidatus Taylorbacteria bacterium RIFCSPLOWO2_02_FULL_43_11]